MAESCLNIIRLMFLCSMLLCLPFCSAVGMGLPIFRKKSLKISPCAIFQLQFLRILSATTNCTEQTGQAFNSDLEFQLCFYFWRATALRIIIFNFRNISNRLYMRYISIPYMNFNTSTFISFSAIIIYIFSVMCYILCKPYTEV